MVLHIGKRLYISLSLKKHNFFNFKFKVLLYNDVSLFVKGFETVFFGLSQLLQLMI